MRISKSPPNADTLGGALYPGAKLDARFSGEKTAENRGEPMVYAYVVRASINDVRAYYTGPGKREAGLPVLNGRGDGLVEILYYISKKKPVSAAQATRVTAAPASANATASPQALPAAAAPAASPAPVASPTPASPSVQPSTPAPTAPAAPSAPDPAKQALDTVNSLRGLFGR